MLVKLSAGSRFVVAVIILGSGVLAGGQVWLHTDSNILGWMTGVVAIGVAGLGWRAFARRATAAMEVRFLGESQAGLDESEFSEFEEETDVMAVRRSKIEQDLESSPQKVADSIRSMLVKGGGQMPAKRGTRRG